jgi:hypothetical protein
MSPTRCRAAPSRVIYVHRPTKGVNNFVGLVGIEPTASSLSRRHSTAELQAQNLFVDHSGPLDERCPVVVILDYVIRNRHFLGHRVLS